MAIDIINNPAIPVVLEGWDYIKSQAGTLISRAGDEITGITDALVGITTPVITFEPPAVNAGTFVRPVAPNAPVIATIDTTMPSAPSLDAIALADLPAAPVDADYSGMAYSKPAAPTGAMPTEPADTDVPLVEIDIPDAPVSVMPADPVLYALNLPEIADLTIPQFEGTRPELTLEAPEHTFNWEYQAFDTAFIDTIKSKLSAMTINGLALPPDIEQAIFDRLRGREDILSKQQIEQASDALASRGFRNPGGLFLKVIDRIGIQQRQAASTANRDLSIEVARQNVEAVKFGISQGIALESAMLQSHIAVQSLTLEAAKATQASFIQIFEAQVALHNAQLEGFKAEASVFESRIRALAAQADVMKTRIEAEKVKGDVNEGLVRAYGEKIRALSSLADMYRAQVEGAKAKGEINVQRLEQARLRIQTFGIKVDAWGKGWDGYKAQVDAETQGLRYYETVANIQSTRVQSFKAQTEAQASRVSSQVAIQGQQIESYRAQIAGATARIQGAIASGELDARVFQSRAGMYAAEGQMSASEVNAINDSERTKLDGSRLTFETAKANAEIAANIAMKRIDQAVEAGRGTAQIWAQLAASVFSGMNLSGSVGYSSNSSIIGTIT